MLTYEDVWHGMEQLFALLDQPLLVTDAPHARDIDR
jgi:hypothetical protein